ncbi:MAG: 2-amino-4-hydroxy-6-hydroxymethyldihydropteridine diphosphokinase, partial [Lentisphaeria bacterium]|nr:2-amino-4-hydroxy-6-hydroxymethyldihydropteridine diphosphokinase [Lentisphaeria bacterium]
MSATLSVDLLIGIGTNLDPERNASFAVRRLRDVFGQASVSTFYRTRPLGEPGQPPYINAVVAVHTHWAVARVKGELKRIESQTGRTDQGRKTGAPRTLDLDLLAYGDSVRAEANLPHSDLVERDFVLIPAAELWPDWVHPVLGVPLARLARERFPTSPN